MEKDNIITMCEHLLLTDIALFSIIFLYRLYHKCDGKTFNREFNYDKSACHQYHKIVYVLNFYKSLVYKAKMTMSLYFISCVIISRNSQKFWCDKIFRFFFFIFVWISLINSQIVLEKKLSLSLLFSCYCSFLFLMLMLMSPYVKDHCLILFVSRFEIHEFSWNRSR